MGNRGIGLVLVCLSCALLIAVASPCKAAVSKTYDASLGTLPDAQGFTLRDTGGSPPYTIQGDAMHQGLTSETGVQYWYSEDIPVDLDVGTVMEAELRITYSSYSVDPWGYRGAGWLMFMADSARRALVVWIASDRVYLTHDGAGAGTANKPFDSTDGFHRYRFVVGNGLGSLFIDGASDPFLSLAVGPSWFPFPNRTGFGDSSTLTNNESLLRSFSYGMEPNPIRYITAETLDSLFLPTGGRFGRGELRIADTCPIFVEGERDDTTYEGGTVTMDVSLFRDDSDDGVAAAVFREGDLSLADAEGQVLLAGEVTEVVLQEVEISGRSQLTGVGAFVVAGGRLAEDFTEDFGDIVQITFDLDPQDIDDFSLAFTGVSNITLMPIPEPATLSLLALGGLALRRRRKR